MEFKYKSEAELTAMTPGQRDTYATDKRAFETEQTNKAVEKALEGPNAIIKELQETVAQLKENPVTGKGDKMAAIRKEFKANQEKLKAIAHGSNTQDQVEYKALTLRANIEGNEQAYDLPDIGQLATRAIAMYDAFPKIRIGSSNNNGVVRYYDWDEATIIRAAAMRAEGALFPESTAKFKKYSLDLKKIGDTLPVTEEFFEDEELFAAELGMFLETNVNLVIDDQICNGDGTGENLTGLFASVNAYTPVASGITDANIYDLANVVAADITKTGGSKYRPDVAFMNIADILKLRLKKDANYNYVIPNMPGISQDGKQIGPITVIEANIVTANTMVLGDRRFARIYEKAGIVLSKGLVGTQFTEDEMTLKARKRLLFLIRNADKGGWRKVTSISAALTTLAT